MKLMGFNFTKINVEKLGGSGKDIKVDTNIDVVDIDSAKIDFFKGKEEILTVKFKYGINYSGNFAKIEFEGNMLISLDPKQARHTLKNWKDKTVSEEVKFFVFSIILRKANVKALQLEDEMNLPFHIPMPRISRDKDK